MNDGVVSKYRLCHMLNSFRLFFIFFLAFQASFVWADRERGVMLEFRKQEEKDLKRRQGENVGKDNLHRNIVKGVRILIQNQLYHQREKYYEGLSIKEIAYENPLSVLVYYVKYKDFLARFEYELDPRLYIQQPKFFKIVLMGQEEKPK